jgi:hypothetical protein
LHSAATSKVRDLRRTEFHQFAALYRRRRRACRRGDASREPREIRVRQQEKFFIAADELEDKETGDPWLEGPQIAMRAIKDNTVSFLKDGE